MIYLIGAGGHGKVVADTFLLNGCLLSILDSNPALEGSSLLGVRIEREERVLLSLNHPADFFVSIGDAESRRRVSERWEEHGHRLVRAIHPTAIVSRSALLELGVCLLAGVIVQADCRIGKGAIINNGVTVDHDTKIGDYVHLAPGVHLAGNIQVGEASWIGIGSSVREGIAIGPRAMVGAGSVVVEDLPGEVVAYGNPCRVVRNRARNA